MTAAALTLTYRLFGHANRDGLVEQDIDYSALGVPVVTPDMTASEFEEKWRRIPLRLRLPFGALVPAYAHGMRLFGSRVQVASHAETDDLPSREDVELASEPRLAPFLDLVDEERNAHLLAALERIHEERCTDAIQVAIVYGARHLPAAVHHLGRRFNYWARDAEWVSVFEW